MNLIGFVKQLVLFESLTNFIKMDSFHTINLIYYLKQIHPPQCRHSFELAPPGLNSLIYDKMTL